MNVSCAPLCSRCPVVKCAKIKHRGTELTEKHRKMIRSQELIMTQLNHSFTVATGTSGCKKTRLFMQTNYVKICASRLHTSREDNPDLD